jgi:hypothetical protein
MARSGSYPPSGLVDAWLTPWVMPPVALEISMAFPAEPAGSGTFTGKPSPSGAVECPALKMSFCDAVTFTWPSETSELAACACNGWIAPITTRQPAKPRILIFSNAQPPRVWMNPLRTYPKEGTLSSRSEVSGQMRRL